MSKKILGMDVSHIPEYVQGKHQKNLLYLMIKEKLEFITVFTVAKKLNLRQNIARACVNTLVDHGVFRREKNTGFRIKFWLNYDQ